MKGYKKMKYTYKENHTISYSELDCNLHLGIINSLSLVQDMMTSYYKHIGSDNITIMKNNNALWVLTRTKIRFYKNSGWKDTIKGTNYTTKLKPIRMEIETKFEDENNELAFLASQELCLIDVDTRKIRKIATVEFPSDIECTESIFDEKDFKVNIDFDESEKVYEQKVMFSDVDLSGHANNVSYAKYFLNTLTSEFLKEHRVEFLEILYIHESVEGDIISIYNKVCGDKIWFLIKCGEKEIVRAGMIVTKI